MCLLTSKCYKIGHRPTFFWPGSARTRWGACSTATCPVAGFIQVGWERMGMEARKKGWRKGGERKRVEERCRKERRKQYPSRLKWVRQWTWLECVFVAYSNAWWSGVKHGCYNSRRHSHVSTRHPALPRCYSRCGDGVQWHNVLLQRFAIAIVITIIALMTVYKHR